MAKEMLSELIYDGSILAIEAYVSTLGVCPTIEFLEKQPQSKQAKFAALFARIGDHGKIMNEQKFKHLSNTSQLFEFKVSDKRVLSFFVVGKRLILSHGFTKKKDKTPRSEIMRAELIKYDFLKRIKYGKKLD